MATEPENAVMGWMCMALIASQALTEASEALNDANELIAELSEVNEELIAHVKGGQENV